MKSTWHSSWYMRGSQSITGLLVKNLASSPDLETLGKSCKLSDEQIFPELSAETWEPGFLVWAFTSCFNLDFVSLCLMSLNYKMGIIE